MSQTFFKRSAILQGKRPFCVFSPTLGDLGVTYDHLRLVGKRVRDFLLVLIGFVSLGRTAEALLAIVGSKSAISLQRGPVDPKFQIEAVALHPTFFFSEN